MAITLAGLYSRNYGRMKIQSSNGEMNHMLEACCLLNLSTSHTISIPILFFNNVTPKCPFTLSFLWRIAWIFFFWIILYKPNLRHWMKKIPQSTVLTSILHASLFLFLLF
jgi:hypothetical protein